MGRRSRSFGLSLIGLVGKGFELTRRVNRRFAVLFAARQKSNTYY